MEFLDALLSQYTKTFDIVRDYEIAGTKAAAYGYFSTVSEKYVISPKANLWKIEGFEHIQFLCKETLSLEDLDKALTLMRDEMAPSLVCKGQKYPPKDHMYSYLTIAYLVDHSPDDALQKAIRDFRFEKNYLFTVRGHVQGHLVVMDLSTGKAYTNKDAKHLIPLYEDTYSKCM